MALVHLEPLGIEIEPADDEDAGFVPSRCARVVTPDARVRLHDDSEELRP